jgi:hypothetical protein
MGEQFGLADIYLFTITYWPLFSDLQISDYLNLLMWRARVGRRPSVFSSLRAEGLISSQTFHVRRRYTNVTCAILEKTRTMHAVQA